MRRIEKETGKLFQEMSNLRTETQQIIINVKCKFGRMGERVNGKIKLHMEEAKLEQTKLGKVIEERTVDVITSKLEEQRVEVDKVLGTVRKEMSNLKQGVTDKTLNTLKETVQVAEKGNVANWKRFQTVSIE